MSTLRTLDHLEVAGLLADRATLEPVAERYAIAIPPALRQLIATPDDPIARQVVPHPEEAKAAPHEQHDPTGDARNSPLPGVVHRYPDRALLLPLLTCPVYCRYCFRRERVGAGDGMLTEAQLDAAIAYFASHKEIREVILSGGDPLMLSPRRLGAIVARLSAIGHIDLLRIHTRVPVATPEAIAAPLLAALRSDTPTWVVMHANHAREITDAVRAGVRKFLAEGMPVLSQSVLLAGVNDSVAALEELFRTLLAARVKPYALHQLDAAPGTARFHVPLERGRALVAALRGRVPGHAIPHYLLDIPGGHGKVPVAASHAARNGSGWIVTDPAGQAHRLADPPESR